jgi:predicted SAM-dependent methyltransferase
MKTREFTNLRGTTLSLVDAGICKTAGFDVDIADMTNLPQEHGYIDESVDFIFARHVLEHSPYPMFTLLEFNRVLTLGGKIYIEVPAPGCERRHEYNANHYSILGDHQLNALLIRAGFKVEMFKTYSYTATLKEGTTFEESSYAVVATKEKNLDIR